MGYAVACNVVDPRCAYISAGSKAYVMYWADSPRLGVRVHTRSGRYVTKWLHIKQLANFRAKWIEIPPCSENRVKSDCPPLWEEKTAAESFAAELVKLLAQENRPPPPGV